MSNERGGGHVLVADDHPVTREGLAMAVRLALSGATVTTAGTIAEAVAAAERKPPDRMILLDLMLPDAHGLSGLMSLQHHAPVNTPIVIITAREDTSTVAAVRAVGAAGYLPKSLPLDHIVTRLREIDGGHQVFPAEVQPSGRTSDVGARIADLSPAQRSVLIALADGRSNKAIAYDLNVTEATIKAHLTAIFRKLGVTNRAQALLLVQPLFGRHEHGGAE